MMAYFRFSCILVKFFETGSRNTLILTGKMAPNFFALTLSKNKLKQTKSISASKSQGMTSWPLLRYRILLWIDLC